MVLSKVISDPLQDGCRRSRLDELLGPHGSMNWVFHDCVMWF